MQDKDLPQLPTLSHFEGQTRAFLKIQDGCDAHCAYCIIPTVRPKLISKPLPKALKEAETLVAGGHKEIVVTGVFLGAYGQKTARRPIGKSAANDQLCELLDQLAQIPDLHRIRISSLEPADVTPGLLDVIHRNDNIMPHLHLSLQSGSDTVLKRMGRRYTREGFIAITEQAKAQLDRPALTTDIIVGFPGETDNEFTETMDLAHTVGFSKMHVFSFSSRSGTAAARMKNPVDSAVMQERSEILRHLDQKLGRQYRAQFLGQTAQILIENTHTSVSGLSERYFQVALDPAPATIQKNDLLTVTLTDHHPEGLQGTLATNQESR